MLELYYFHGATCGLKARLTMAEKGADYTPRVLTREDLKAPDYLKLNPNAVVPTLVDDGSVLVESSIIMRYIDDVVDGPALRPTAPLDHAMMGMWMKRADEYYLPATGTFTYTIGYREELVAKLGGNFDDHLSAIPNPTARERRRKILEDGYESADFGAAVRTLDGMLALMETQLTDTAYLAGDNYSLADAAITPFLERMKDLACDGWWLANRPAVSDWWDRIQSRDSYDQVLGPHGHPAAISFAEKGAAARERILSLMENSPA
jgi:glutathione S-transferase